MNEIRKFSAEWFAQKDNSTQRNYAKNFEQGYNADIFNRSFNEEKQKDLTGNKADLIKKINESIASDDPTIEAEIIDAFGGAENFFNLVDTDNDGKITSAEIHDVAALNTEELEQDDTLFSVKDLKILYENVVKAEGAEVTTAGNTTKYSYKDGSQTEITKDESGDIISKKIVEYNNKKKQEKLYHYDTETTVVTDFDEKGREVSSVTDTKGTVNDRKSFTNYNDENGTKIVEVETAGRTITRQYDKNGKMFSEVSNLKYHSDGVIEDTRQNDIGDCWLLSGVNALKTTKIGQKIIKDAIKRNIDGSVTVSLKGVGKEYTYTPEQIGSKDYGDLTKSLSSGDIDMQLIERAIADYRTEVITGKETEKSGFWRSNLAQATIENPLENGNLSEAILYLADADVEAGVSTQMLKNSSKQKKTDYVGISYENLLNNKRKNPEKYATTVSFKVADLSVGTDENGENNIVSNHAYAISKVEKDMVYVINPHDSSKEIQYPLDKFMKNIQAIQSVKLK